MLSKSVLSIIASVMILISPVSVSAFPTGSPFNSADVRNPFLHKISCENTFDESHDPAGIGGFVKPKACIWAGDDPEGKKTTTHQGDRPITFGNWENEPCGTHGSGWHQKGGTCGTGKGTGFKRCAKVILELGEC